MVVIEDFNEIDHNKIMNKPKLTFNKFIIAVAAVLFLAVVFIITVVAKSRKSTICFYGIPSNIEKSLEKELKAIKNEDGKNYKLEFKSLNADLPLTTQLPKKTVAVITVMGKSAENLTEHVGEKIINKANISPSLLSDFTLSVQQTASFTKKEKVSMMPFLCDSVEIDLETRLLRKNKNYELNTFAQLENYVDQVKSEVIAPIAFAGADSIAFLNMITALTETFEGKDAVLKAKDLILSANNNWDFNALIYDDNAPLYNACSTVARWRKLNLISTETMRYTTKNLENLMSERQTAALFTTLSNKRAIQNSKTLRNYITVPEANEQKTPFIPSTQNLTNRSCVASVICIIPTSKKDFTYFYKSLASEAVQEKLSRSTGLAPAHRQCKVPDIQAGDLRFWIATTNAPVTSLAYSAFTNENDRKEFIQELLEEIYKL